jgi:hypothetical protein
VAGISYLKGEALVGHPRGDCGDACAVKTRTDPAVRVAPLLSSMRTAIPGHCNQAGFAYSASRGRFMRPLQIRARIDADADCLMRELAAYSPTRSRKAVLIELEERSEIDVLGILAAVETCLSANEIRSVRIQLDGRSYMLAPSG